ncbi:ADP-ribosylation factor-like protein 14 [Larimichthys crocea]|uniref:Uncharacterized protein n=1 Tax=Larimichthys crocea TaxID=215358 RepID=A0ACD3QY90_LARCR|nr:ADP-ribosylation factor-like protein 14 [Larimichthys crocea]
MGQARSSTSPQVILMGLDSAGKSTLLARLLTGQVMDTSPTIGFNVGTLDLDKKTSLTVWDVGGQKNMRPNWRYYIDECKALVFVVDSSDPARLPEAQKALKKVLADEKLRGIPLMVLANKKDLPNSMTIREVQRPALPTNNLTSSTADANNDAQRNNPRLNELKEKIQQMEMLPPVLLTILFPLSQISKQLDLPSYTNRLWEIQACSALKGLGLQQAFMSVNKLIKKS